MADIASLVRRYLSTSSKLKRLNYYTVLGLDELLDDRTTIAMAVEAAIERLKAADRTSDPAGFEQVVKIVRQARATLLDEAKKRSYDIQLRSALDKASLTLGSASERPQSESARLLAWLPKGDPTAPFSMSDFLKLPVDDQDIETPAQRHVALAEMAKASTKTSNAIATDNFQAEAATELSGSTNESVPSIEWPGAERSSGRELQEQIRRNRIKKNRIATSVAIGSSLVVLSIGVWMFVSNQLEYQRRTSMNSQRATLSAAIRSTTSDSTLPNDIQPVTPQRTSKTRMNLGLPLQTTTDNVGVLPKIGGEVEPELPLSEKTNADVPKPVPATVPEPTKALEPSVQPKMIDESPQAMEKKPDSVQWRKAMIGAREAIGAKEFKSFTVEIEKALSLSGNDMQEEQCRRLDKFGQLYQKGLMLVDESIAGLTASQAISYGSTGKASVVEVKSNELILRISGKNEKYAFDKLPMGILLAVIEPKLNDTAIDQAIRGILCTADARSNPATKKQAKVFFEKAATLDDSFAKLDQVLQETYQ